MIPELDPARDGLSTGLARDLSPFPSFAAATGAVLNHLQENFGFGMWMVTRVAGDEWVVLTAAGEAYQIAAGDVFSWSESFCAKMVHGLGPRVAPRAMDVPAYAGAPIATKLAIGSYVGVPLIGPSGELFGSLCAIDPEPAAADLVAAQPLFELQARLLASLLTVELTTHQQHRRADLAEFRDLCDPQTGLLDRSGWQALLAREQMRCDAFASTASVVVIELARRDDGADDTLLADTGRVLWEACRADDVVARTGADTFAVLSVETPEAVGQRIATRLQHRLSREGISACFGVAALGTRGRSLHDAWARADTEMRADVGLRHAAAAAPVPAQAVSPGRLGVSLRP